MKSPCQTAITNLSMYYEKISSSTSSKEELLGLYDAVHDRKFELNFNGNRTSYKRHRDYSVNYHNNLPDFQISNFETEVLDNITFHYTFDVHEEGIQKKMHEIATVNPNNGKIISKNIMTGQAMLELLKFNEKYIETKTTIEKTTTPLVTYHSHSTNGSKFRKLSSSALYVLMNSDKDSKNIASTTRNRRSTMSKRISAYISRSFNHPLSNE